VFAMTLRIFAMAAVLLASASCGVGTDGTGPSSANSFSVGAVTGLAENTVTVNGVTYDRGDAEVVDGFGQAIGADQVRLGMWVELSGSVDDSAGSAKALSIRVRPAARGTVSAVDRGRMTVTLLESTVRYDVAATVLEGLDAAGAVAPGDVLEVHGALGETAGSVEASRIERLSAESARRQPVELRGKVSQLNAVARTLVIGEQRVSYANALLTLPKAPQNGQLLRVSSFTAPLPGQAWPVERMTTDQPVPDKLDFVYLEGVSTDWTPGPLFKLEGVPIDASSAFNRGKLTGNGQRVAVIGSLVAGTVKAKSLALTEPGQAVQFVLSAVVTDFRSIADFRVRGVGVDASAAVFVGGTAADVVDGRRVKVIGILSGRRLIASRVEML
jgi:Domain of unknown function (DUF5666)